MINCCFFSFTVDTQPPIVVNCPSDQTSVISIGAAGASVSWDEPEATDESGSAELASISHNPGSFFGIGSTTVTYRFTDTSGNIANCIFNVIVTEGK